MLGLGASLSRSGGGVDAYNYSVVLDGNDYLTVSDDDSLSFGDGSSNTSMSISFWLKVDDLSGTSYQGILVKGEEYEIHINETYDRLLFRRVDNSANARIYKSSANGSIIEGTWQHVLITSDDSEDKNGINFYINGSLSNLGGTTGGSYVASENDSADLYIGRGVGTVAGTIGTTYKYLTGSMANIAFWNAELTGANAVTLYNGGKDFDIANSGIATANLQASWKFAEQTGTTVADSSSNSNTASFNGDPTWTTE